MKSILIRYLFNIDLHTIITFPMKSISEMDNLRYRIMQTHHSLMSTELSTWGDSLRAAEDRER